MEELESFKQYTRHWYKKFISNLLKYRLPKDLIKVWYLYIFDINIYFLTIYTLSAILLIREETVHGINLFWVNLTYCGITVGNGFL